MTSVDSNAWPARSSAVGVEPEAESESLPHAANGEGGQGDECDCGARNHGGRTLPESEKFPAAAGCANHDTATAQLMRII